MSLTLNIFPRTSFFHHFFLCFCTSPQMCFSCYVILPSSRKTRLRRQASNEQADAQSMSQVSREMLPIHCHGCSCLSNAMVEYTSPVKRFPPKTANEKKLLSTESLTFTLTKIEPDYRLQYNSV